MNFERSLIDDEGVNQAERLTQLQLSVKTLLSWCDENEVQVPEKLLESIRQDATNAVADPGKPRSHKDFLNEKRSERTSIEEHDMIQEFHEIRKIIKPETPYLDLRIQDGKYEVTNYFDNSSSQASENGDSKRARQRIRTVKTESPVYKLIAFLKQFVQNKGNLKRHSAKTVIIDKVNLVCEPGKMYLVLGAPGSGKSTLLKMIAQTLHKSKDHRQTGTVSITGVSPARNIIWSNLVAYIDQIDRLHPYLTVFETCEFAWRCRSGGTHRRIFQGDGPDVDDMIAKLDDELTVVNKILEAMGLARVKDTFVGDQENVRGISGGEKKRVTVAEMLCVGSPIICCDEISTGLDAATTYDITKWMGAVTRITETIKLVSLLQPPPETVALFDEVILLSNGKVVYSGPIDEVIDYFCNLGYEIPERMDVADWLQALPTKDGVKFIRKVGSEMKHLSTDEFVEKFYSSPRGNKILERLNAPSRDGADMVKTLGGKRFENSSFASLRLLIRRELKLWWRDKYQIKATLLKSLIMGIVAGTLFWQSDSPNSIVSILFQSMFYSCVGAMTSIVKQFAERPIFYKQQDANFFPTWTYVVGRSVASVPTSLIDSVGYGTIIFWFVGLAHNDGATVGNYFIFLLLLFVVSLTAVFFFSVFSASVSVVTIAQPCQAITMLAFILFSGFTVQPDVIPVYFIWIYWINFFAWILRGLAVNEFDSGKYDDEAETSEGLTEGELILTRFGFTINDDPFSREWVWWGLLFAVGCTSISLFVSTFFLDRIRFATGASLVTDKGSDEIEDLGREEVYIPFKRAKLTFRDVHYTVTASTSEEKLELLKGVDGVVEAGLMTALMGSSGAGKTTLMDVLAMRKSSGEISGDIRVNGHSQEKLSFRRMMGYVEQFDTQTPQLTIRETVSFSAKLRLEEKVAAVVPDSMEQFVEQTLHTLELTNIQDLQVGSDETGGLSFEQRKRLSIAIELVANPSILFLDEPTSGLDARAAAIVMRGLKRIALSGRSVCATIHQPSIAIFNEFDRLLLLKRGGETIFFGNLGENSCNLISYLEGYEGTTCIQAGENPATWMLTTIGAGSAANPHKPFDYAGKYQESNLRRKCLDQIDSICASSTPEGKVLFAGKYAASVKTQFYAVLLRTMKVYFRSPSYNVIRVMVSGTVALLFSSVYASQRVPGDEADMNSRVNSLYIAVLFPCVNALNSVLRVFEVERNMFYRHKAASMYDSRAITRAYTIAEVPFVFIASLVFSILFYFPMGFALEADKFFIFLLIIFLTISTFTFTGQMLIGLFRDSQTAQGFGGLFITFTSLFSGILLRPDAIPNFWIFMYWLMPGHYIYEGLIMSQFNNDNSPIVASVGSPFYDSLRCTDIASQGEDCVGTAEEWIASSFPDWSIDNVPYNILYLIGIIIITRAITYFALTHLDYRSN